MRDDEIRRLVLYLRSLGATVNIRNYKADYFGETTLEPKFIININKRKQRSKTELIMTLLHESAHVKYAILNNYKVSEDFIKFWEKEETTGQVPKKLRKDVVDFEINSLELMVNIAQELQLKIPMRKILMQKILDQFMYEYVGKHGKFPHKHIIKNKWKALQEKYK